ncbi:PGR5-like B [Arabidopsis thaliana]|uniref:PGR5-like B n=1 Tax=Arabidopsis thaliana TaxID=3702 RepID=F4JPU9_ARATH|nr:PGR5-like B [Arabidopsis thaliana]AEE83075.1 PGR5-like B [Arabidopsis thaliana]|eukprot:NP_001190702.1 PGR5-like B [Arabidopsis thaliana]
MDDRFLSDEDLPYCPLKLLLINQLRKVVIWNFFPLWIFSQVGGEEVDSKILPYCSINKNEKRTIGEMEQEFLQAMQSFYYEGKAIMSNEEFDNLKEELMWEGSSVVMLSSDEQRFLEASMAYVSGNPILSDEEYDKLKMKLKMDGSEIVCEGPRCSLRSKKVYSDLAIDYFKMFLLNVPATVVALGLFFFLDDITGFEITYLLELPEPFSFIFTWFAAVPAIVYLALSLTKLILKDFLILKGPCPNCGTENVSFFGTILSIPNDSNTNNVKCSGCGTEMVYDSGSRLITLPEGGKA